MKMSRNATRSWGWTGPFTTGDTVTVWVDPSNGGRIGSIAVITDEGLLLDCDGEDVWWPRTGVSYITAVGR
jgi:acyl dehydratase